MDSLEKIRTNNNTINEMIEKIIEEKDEDCYHINENGEKGYSPILKKLIEMEIQKILKIYRMEMPNIPYSEEIGLSIYDGTHPDGKYERSSNEISFSYSIKNEFDKINDDVFMRVLVGYKIDENGRIQFIENGNNEKIKVNLVDKKDGTPYMITEDELVENELDFKEEALYLYLNNKKPDHYILKTLPHELVHFIGFEGGLFEGLTENISREICKKYNINNFPSSRKKLVKLTQKIEKIVGRDFLVQNANVKLNKGENIDAISDGIDSIINGEESGLYKKYFESEKEYNEYTDKVEQEYIDEYKAGKITREEAIELIKQKEREEEFLVKRDNLYKAKEKYFNNLNDTLTEYIENNPEKLYKLGDTEINPNEEHINDVLEYQQSEIEELNRIIEEIKEKKENVINKLNEQTIQEQGNVQLLEEVEEVEKSRSNEQILRG